MVCNDAIIYGFPVLIGFNIYGIFKYWTKYKLMTLITIFNLGVSIMSLRVWDIRAITIRRFKKYLPDYEAFIAKVQKEHKTGDMSRIEIPNDYKHLGYIAHANFSDPNNLEVIVVVGSVGFAGHTYFVYSSSGKSSWMKSIKLQNG